MTPLIYDRSIHLLNRWLHMCEYVPFVSKSSFLGGRMFLSRW